MSGNESDTVRQQYMKRALSLMLRTTDYDAVTARSLDVLCTVGILYMQTMFSHVHTYAEHATRTRPNMNDVGRALDERRVTVAQLDAYRQAESMVRVGEVEEAVGRLGGQASVLRRAGAECGGDGRMRAFVDTRAEDVLRRLIGFHKERVEQRERAEGVGGGDLGGGAADADDDEDEDEDFAAPELGSMHLPPAAVAEGGQTVTTSEGGQTVTTAEGGQAVTTAEDTHTANMAEDTHTDNMAEDTHTDNMAEGDTAAVASSEGAASPAPKEAKPDEIERMLLPLSALPDHVPAQCPLFPSPHTYKQTPVFPKREQDFFRTRMHKAEQSRQAEENLQRLISGPHAEQTMLRAGADPDARDAGSLRKDRAQKRILQLFPPVNFHDMHKRSRLAQWRLQNQPT
ncbi:transcription initiation factor TFIID subunit 8 [Coemansia erecta]|nr:transcription initiation factor TFIID subunit 8 [Coemansia sp. RSA 2618]KAJ2818237.1 transcription initiation factor TFIID subunit 8 [Coemansia erecta]